MGGELRFHRLHDEAKTHTHTQTQQQLKNKNRKRSAHPEQTERETEASKAWMMTLTYENPNAQDKKRETSAREGNADGACTSPVWR